LLVAGGEGLAGAIGRAHARCGRACVGTEKSQCVCAAARYALGPIRARPDGLLEEMRPLETASTRNG
jgi:hypothetical protein